MSKNKALIDCRADLRDQMAKGAYQALPGTILQRTGALVCAVSTRLGMSSGEVSKWYSAGIIALITLLIGSLISLILGQKLSAKEIQFTVWIAVMGSLLLIANKRNVDLFLDTFFEAPLDAITSLSDLQHLQHWLKVNMNPLLPLSLGVVFGPIVGLVLAVAWRQQYGTALHTGPMVVAMLASIQAILVIYYVYPFYIVLPARISRYRFKLYAADPSSSIVVDQISDLFTSIMIITVVYVVLTLLGLTYFELMTVGTALIVGVTTWAPALALYVGGQRNIAKMIARTKWETLNEIQAKIEKLQAAKDGPTTTTLEHLDKLMDYHDRIKATPNSALDLRSRLTFVNSLFLPLLALVLSNSDIVAELIRWIRDRLNGL